jgi:hypothetical protein
MILFQRGRKMTELCATRMELDYAFVEFPQLFRARAFPGFDVVVTLPIRLHIPDDRESRRGLLSVRCKNSKTTAGGQTLSFDYIFDIPVDVAAAVYKYPPRCCRAVRPVAAGHRTARCRRAPRCHGKL